MLSVRLELSWPLRVGVAALSMGAGIIHLAMVPSHMEQWAVEGLAFAVAGWLQLAVAVAVLARPTRPILWTAALSSLVLLGLWAASRAWGLPLGPHAGIRSSAETVDVTSAVLQAGVFVAAITGLYRPSLGSAWDSGRLVAASVVPVAVLVATTTALASPSARDHAHGTGEVAADGTANGAGHAHRDDVTATPVADDLGLSLLTNGHHHEMTYHPLDPATQAALDAQLEVTREVARQYPTVADAEAAGYRRSGPYSPGLGAHYTRPNAASLNAEGIMTEEALRNPMGLLYTGTDPDDRIAGFMYYSSSEIEPFGFVGTNDTWHIHKSICLTSGPDGIDAPFGADHAATPEQCAQVNGRILESTQWMTHVWSVPGFENGPEGVFAEVNPLLACSDGTYFQRAPERWIDNLHNTCVSNAAGSPT